MPRFRRGRGCSRRQVYQSYPQQNYGTRVYRSRPQRSSQARQAYKPRRIQIVPDAYVPRAQSKPKPSLPMGHDETLATGSKTDLNFGDNNTATVAAGQIASISVEDGKGRVEINNGSQKPIKVLRRQNEFGEYSYEAITKSGTRQKLNLIHYDVANGKNVSKYNYKSYSPRRGQVISTMYEVNDYKDSSLGERLAFKAKSRIDLPRGALNKIALKPGEAKDDYLIDGKKVRVTNNTKDYIYISEFEVKNKNGDIKTQARILTNKDFDSSRGSILKATELEGKKASYNVSTRRDDSTSVRMKLIDDPDYVAEKPEAEVKEARRKGPPPKISILNRSQESSFNLLASNQKLQQNLMNKLIGISAEQQAVLDSLKKPDEMVVLK